MKHLRVKDANLRALEPGGHVRVADRVEVNRAREAIAAGIPLQWEQLEGER